MAMSRFKLIFFIPKENTQNVLGHLFRKFPNDLGKIGNYEQCAFIQRGTGQFKPVDGANPTTGSIGNLERVAEDRVEITLIDRGGPGGGGKTVRDAIKELKSVHPYEEVVYDVYKLEEF